MDPSALGHIIEGTVERDPLTEKLQILTVGDNGRARVIDIETLVAAFIGKEVRLTLASFENLARLAKMVEDQNSGQVYGVMPDELPSVSFDVSRKGVV